MGFTVGAHDLRNWIAGNVLAALFMVIAILAYVARFWFRRAESWRKRRSLAEAIKGLAWRYTMHVISHEEYLDEYRRQRQQSDKLRLTPPTPDAAEITPRMTELRNATPGEQQQVYLSDRLMNQRVWYGKKAASYQNLTTGLQWARGIAYAAGFVLIFVTWVGPSGFAVMTTIAGGFATWLVGKHYDDLFQSYTVMSRKLLDFEARAAKILPESQASGADQQASWAAFVNEVETLLDGEHQDWLREIAAPQDRPQPLN